MLKLRWRRIFLITVILSLAITYLVLWIRMLNDPVQYTGTDFVPFYAASQISKNEGPSQAYNLELQRVYEERLGNFIIQTNDVRIFLNPPFIIPLVNLVSSPDFLSSLIKWEILNFLFVLAGAYQVFLLLRDDNADRLLFLFLLGIISFFPGYKSLVIGQNSAMLFLGAIMLMTGTIKKKDWLAGVGLAIMTIRPHIVIPLIFPFLFKQRKVLWWFILSAAALALISLIYVGLDGIKGFFAMLAISGSGSNTTTGEISMVNLIGILLRSFPNLPASFIRWIGWGSYTATILGLSIYWKKSQKIDGKQISLAILITTFTVPHIHMHDLVLWSIPLVVFLLNVKNDNKISFWAASMPWWLSLAFLSCFFSPFLEATIPYIILAFLFSLTLKPNWLIKDRISESGEVP